MPAFKRFRLVVTTCVSASIAYGVGVPRGHFTHIFVDEAGHATEPEAMIGIKTMADNSTNVILSGDPKQLGPIIRSPVSRELGLEKSYLERIMEGNSHDAKRGYGITYVRFTVSEQVLTELRLQCSPTRSELPFTPSDPEIPKRAVLRQHAGAPRRCEHCEFVHQMAYTSQWTVPDDFPCDCWKGRPRGALTVILQHPRSSSSQAIRRAASFGQAHSYQFVLVTTSLPNMN